MIKSISVNNFKSLSEIKVEVPDFAVLVGYNGSGKTNFVNALNLISLLARGEQVESALTSLDLIPGELLSDPADPKIEFAITMIVGGNHIEYRFTIEQSQSEDRMKYTIANESLVNGNKNKPIIQRNQEKISIESEDENDLRETQLVANQLALSVFKKPQIISDAQRVLSSMTTIDLGNQFLRRPGTITTLETELPRNLTELIYDLQRNSPDRYPEFLLEIKKIVPELEKLEVMPSKDRLLLTFQEAAQAERIFSSYSASDGNLRTMAILASVLRKPKPSVLVVDEIENSFHPARIGKIIKFLEYICSAESGKMQFIVTTHSPIVLNYVDPNEIVYVVKKGGFTTMTNPYNNSRVWNQLGRSLKDGVKLGEMYSVGLLEDILSTE